VTVNIVYRRTGNNVAWNPDRDVWWHEAMETARPYCPPEHMDSEDNLFMLFTSGSTGKPKGLVHTTGGYLLYAALTHRTIFDLRENDIYACVADVGWVTGHSYIVYGPLCNGSTTFMFESTPLYPTAARYWDMVERHKINIFYTSPTALRALMAHGDAPVKRHDRSSLRILGSVGEPINPEAWRWFYEVVGDSNRFIVDTYWQTETGGMMCTPFPGATNVMKPGLCMLPFFGVEPVMLDAQSVR
jgi:acetyl-CoA synthetase